MAHYKCLVAAIKHNGKILREIDKFSVYLPFLAEYQIFIKNINTKDVSINITINNINPIEENRQLIIKANSNFTLDGFINKENKTISKFIHIQNSNDTLIKLDYKFFIPQTTPAFSLYYTSLASWLPTEHYKFHSPSENLQQESTKINPFMPSFEESISPVSQLEDEFNSITICLKGQDVPVPVYVKSKLICSKCGSKNKSNIKFCPRCGMILS